MRHTNTSGTAYVNSLTFSISSANTWEQKVLVFNGNTAQDIRNTNTEGLRLEIYLAVGSNFTSGGGANANSWTTGNTNRASASNVNLMTSTDNDFFLTGVQMEVGEFTSSTLPPFQHETFDENKKRCARYYYKVAEHGADGLTNQTIGMGYYKSTSQWRILCYLPVRPRTNPSLDSTSGTNFYINDLSGIDDTFNGVELTRSNSDILQVVHVASNVSGTVGQAGESVAVASGAYIAFKAEL